MRKWVMAGGAVLALGLSSPAAMAVEDRFDYFEFKGTRTGDIDGGGISADIEEGLSLEAAKSANDVVFVRGQVDAFNLEAEDAEISDFNVGDFVEGESGVELLSIGPGVGLPLGDWAHAWGQVSYERLSYFGNVGNGGGAEVGASIGPEDGVRLGLSARHGEPSFTGDEDFEYQLYEVDGRVPVADETDLVLSYQEGTFETEDGDVDLNEVVSLGVRMGF